MMRKTRTSPHLLSTALVAALAGGLAACSLIVEFDPEGKPCGNGGACLDGYVCNADNKCVLDDGTFKPSPDGGVQILACGGRCTGGQVCLEKRNECVEPGCSTVACAAGEVCVMQGDAPTCVVEEKGRPGAQCFHDNDCAAEEFCLISSVPTEGDNRKGFCTRQCSSDADCPTPNAETMRTACVETVSSNFRICQRVALGSHANSPRPTYVHCTRNDDCADFPGRTCAVFDSGLGSNKTLSAPVSFCDAAYESGVAAGSSCSPKEGVKSKNGLCLPGGEALTGYASQRCQSDADCFEGSSCRPSQFEQPVAKFGPDSTFFPVRRIDLCVKDSKRCSQCETDADCSPDAPVCVEMPTGGDPATAKYCTTECTARAVPSALISGCPTSTGWQCKAGAGSERGACVANRCGLGSP